MNKQNFNVKIHFFEKFEPILQKLEIKKNKLENSKKIKQFQTVESNF